MDEVTLRRAILHLADLGDTDILPPLFEFQFYLGAVEPIVARLLNYQFGTYCPVGAFEVLSPKTQTSFRIAHQLYATDSLLFTAAAIDVAPAIDERRLEPGCGAFSYRFDPDPTSSRLFNDSCTFHDWLVSVTELCKSDSMFATDKLVLETDISDFYGRIYFHRIEHMLDDIEAKNSSRRIIENVIKSSRARQSYGLPVGGAASRIIAEGVLIDIDTMLRRQGLSFTRYVDDFRIILDNPAAAHTALCKLAEHLMLTEGLSLNAAKTRITTASSIVAEIEGKFSEVFTEEERNGLGRYFQAIYDGEDVTDILIDDIDSTTLITKLKKILKSENIDYTSVKLILKALRATNVDNPVLFVEEFQSLLYFIPRDFCLLVGALAQKNEPVAEEIAERILTISKQSPHIEMTLARIWVNHLFVAGALKITDLRLQELPLKESIIEKRQNILLKGRLGDRAFFREGKTRFGDLSEWEKPAMMLAASCLATSEYEAWLNFCKDRYSDLFSLEYINWLKNNRVNLFEKLNVNFTIKSNKEKYVDVFANFNFKQIDVEAQF